MSGTKLVPLPDRPPQALYAKANGRMLWEGENWNTTVLVDEEGHEYLKLSRTDASRAKGNTYVANFFDLALN